MTAPHPSRVRRLLAPLGALLAVAGVVVLVSALTAGGPPEPVAAAAGPVGPAVVGTCL
ncbi:hypothetical protein GSF26_26110, partial [Pseudonocardia alni]|nr:hypothetical protein [Pseudonocardia alni]